MRKMTLGLTALTALGLSACKTDDRIKELEASNALMRETLTMMTQGQ